MDDKDQKALELIEQAEEKHQKRQQEQQEFLDAIADESEAKIIETTAKLAEGFTVEVSAKRNGELMDRMGHIEEKLEYVEDKKHGTYKISEAADDASQLLDDLVEDNSLDKETFYQVYRSEGLETLGTLLERAFDAIEQEVERRQGTADGFRQQS